jgi:hypothetical protein
MRKKPKWVELGKITLDDRVAKFAPGTGSDALVFIRAKGMEPSWKPPGTRSLRPSGSAEVSFVDAKSGEVLAFIRFGILPNVNKTTDRSFPSRLRDALHDVPLPAPPPKK